MPLIAGGLAVAILIAWSTTRRPNWESGPKAGAGDRAGDVLPNDGARTPGIVDLREVTTTFTERDFVVGFTFAGDPCALMDERPSDTLRYSMEMWWSETEHHTLEVTRDPVGTRCEDREEPGVGGVLRTRLCDERNVCKENVGSFVTSSEGIGARSETTMTLHIPRGEIGRLSSNAFGFFVNATLTDAATGATWSDHLPDGPGCASYTGIPGCPLNDVRV